MSPDSQAAEERQHGLRYCVSASNPDVMRQLEWLIACKIILATTGSHITVGCGKRCGELTHQEDVEDDAAGRDPRHQRHAEAPGLVCLRQAAGLAGFYMLVHAGRGDLGHQRIGSLSKDLTSEFQSQKLCREQVFSNKGGPCRQGRNRMQSCLVAGVMHRWARAWLGNTTSIVRAGWQQEADRKGTRYHQRA